MSLIDSTIPGKSFVDECLFLFGQELRFGRIWEIDQIDVCKDAKDSSDCTFDEVDEPPSLVRRMVANLNQAVCENVGKPLDE